MRTTTVGLGKLGGLALTLALAGCGGGDNSTGAGANSAAGGSPAAASKSYPGTDDGAKALLDEFVKPGADGAALSKPLRPSKADYDAVFEPDLAAKANAAYTPAWDAGEMVVAPKPGQTQVLLSSATSEDLKAWTGGADAFPGGWKDVGAHLKPGVKFYRFKFVEPGSDTGMAYDGLAHVNGNWRIFPKPWRLLR